METQHRHSILLGGIGGDSHSVGLTVLRQALLMNGYGVHSLGTQSELEEFFQIAPLANVVMISSMDGHAFYYLRSFVEMMNKYKPRDTLWYLGGNLHIGSGLGYEALFLNMGFDKVFTKFIDIQTVLDTLAKDLAEVAPKTEYPLRWNHPKGLAIDALKCVTDSVLELPTLRRIRKNVLNGWRTGREAKDLETNAEFLVRQPSFLHAQEQVNRGKIPILIQPRSGVPLITDQIRLFKAFKSIGIQVLSYQADSLTRNNNYLGAEEAIRESKAGKGTGINGFPIINHGVSGLRHVISEVKLPLQARHSTRDPRLLAEISYAGGVTSFEGGAICYNIPYYKNYPLEDSIPAWQYVDRLTGLYYEQFGIELDREFFGTLTATLIPPSIAIVVNILEAALAVKQGVRCLSLGYAEQGHRPQDIAAIRTLRKMTERTIRNMGYKDVKIQTVFHQYMAAFPENQERASELICNSAVTASLSGATRIITKTAVEAIRIPALEDNLHGLGLVMRGIADAALEDIDEVEIAAECEVIEREVEAMIESILLCGKGSIAEGIVQGFRKGYLDIPFSPSIYNRGEAMTARDVNGAVRFLTFGCLQFPRELREFHREKMSERRRADGFWTEKQNYLLIERDVLQIARGDYKEWPLHKKRNKTDSDHERPPQLFANA